jgi:hypothetical protein
MGAKRATVSSPIAVPVRHAYTVPKPASAVFRPGYHLGPR